MPLSGVAPLYYGFINCLDGRQLERIVLDLLSLERRFLSLVCLERVSSSAGWKGLLGWVGRLLGPSLVTSLSCLNREVLMSSRQ